MITSPINGKMDVATYYTDQCLFLPIDLNNNQKNALTVLYEASNQLHQKENVVEKELLSNLFKQAVLLGQRQQQLLTRKDDLKIKKQQLLEHAKHTLILSEERWIEQANQITLKITQLSHLYRNSHNELKQKVEANLVMDLIQKEKVYIKSEAYFARQERLCSEVCQNNRKKFAQVQGWRRGYQLYEYMAENDLKALQELSSSINQKIRDTVKKNFEVMQKKYVMINTSRQNVKIAEPLNNSPIIHEFLKIYYETVKSLSTECGSLSNNIDQLEEEIQALTYQNKRQMEEVDTVL